MDEENSKSEEEDDNNDKDNDLDESRASLGMLFNDELVVVEMPPFIIHP